MKFFLSRSTAGAFFSLTLCVHASPLILPEIQSDGLSELGATQQAIDSGNDLVLDDVPFGLNIESQALDISDNNDPTFNMNGVSFGGYSPPRKSGDLHGGSRRTPTVEKASPPVAVPEKAREDETSTNHKGEMCTLDDRKPDPKLPTINYVSNDLCTVPDDDSATKSKKIPPDGPICTVYDVWYFFSLYFPFANCLRKIKNYPTRGIAIRRLLMIATMGD